MTNYKVTLYSENRKITLETEQIEKMKQDFKKGKVITSKYSMVDLSKFCFLEYNEI